MTQMNEYHDTRISELQAISLREIELEAERERLSQRRLELLGLAEGTRKNSRNTIRPENRKAAFSALKGKADERSTTQRRAMAR